MDRETGTNDFYVATNAHVAALADETVVPNSLPDPDPKLLAIKIGRQELDRNLKNDNPKFLVDAAFQSISN